MRLDRPTHVLKLSNASMWMSEFTEEIPGQIAAGINALGHDDETSYSIYPLPADAQYDVTIYPDEWIQTTGIAPDRLTVEIRRLDPDNTYRVYTVGHCEAENETDATEPIRNGDYTYLVRPAEVLSADEAIDLFQHYYDHHAVAAGWHLREQPEFATPNEPGATPAGTPPANVSGGTPPGSTTATQSSTAATKDTTADKSKSQRHHGAN
jgi:hypothetical protein